MPVTNGTFTKFSRAAKFTNISSLTIFFPASQGADETRIYYLGFLGQWSEVSAVMITIYNGEGHGGFYIEKVGPDYHCI